MNIQQIEDEEYEFNARYDYISEAFHGLTDDPAMLEYEMRACAEEWEADMTAAYGPVVCSRPTSTEIPF